MEQVDIVASEVKVKASDAIAKEIEEELKIADPEDLTVVDKAIANANPARV